MKKLHERLARNHKWYSDWHALSSVSAIHFVLLAGVGAFFASSIQYELLTQYAAVAPTVFEQRESIGRLNSRTLQLVKQYRTASSDADRMAIRTQLETLLEERRIYMKEQMVGNAEGFVLNAMPAGIYAQLPDFVQQKLESHVEVEGVLTEIHVDTLPESMGPSQQETIFTLATDTGNGKKSYRIRFQNEPPANAVTDARVRVRGIALDADIVPIDGAKGTEGTTVISGGTVDSASTVERTLVILVNFTDAATQPFTKEQINGVVFGNSNSANSFYKETSFGAVSLSGDVVGWYTIPYSAADCKTYYDRNGLAAEQAATAAGIAVSTYPRRVYVFNCQLGGLGTVGGNPSRTWIGYVSLSSVLNPSVFAHELGHNFGTRHAQWIKCGAKQIDVYTNCTIDEYGDRTDVMGAMWGYYHQFNVQRKVSKNWLSSSANVQTVTSSGIYTVTASETNDATIKALKIAKPNTSEFYYVSYRQPIGFFDSSIPAAFINGAGIHIWNGILTSQTKLVDTTPGDSNSLNAPLTDGATFTDPLNGITITQVSHSATGVQLSVQFGGAACVRSAPTVTVSPLSVSGKGGQTLSYGVSVKNNDSSACPTTTFAQSASAPSGWTATMSSASMNLAPGASGSATASITPPATVADGSYTVNITANDPTVTGHGVTAQGAYVVFTPIVDTTVPTTSITSPVSNATVGGIVAVAAVASDNVGVTKVELWADGALVATDTSAPYAWGWDTAASTIGSHTLSTKAYDAAGNSAVSSPVMVNVSTAVDTTRPVVTITSPANGTKIRGNGNVSISASATDDRGVIASMTVTIDGALVKTCTATASCSYNWSGKSIKSGTHTIAITAKDPAGNSNVASVTISK